MKNIISILISFCLICQFSQAQNPTLSGTIWIDEDFNFINTGELGLNDVKVYLKLVSTNAIVDSTLTADFEFNFPSMDGEALLPGLYYLEVPKKEFDPGGPLLQLEPCGAGNDANDGVDNDDNGSFGVPLVSTSFLLDTSHVDYVDLCLYYSCDEEIIFAKESCDLLTADDLFCSITALDNLCGVMFQNNSQGNQPNPLCPEGGGPHNISWIAFVADDGDYSVTITPTGCTSSQSGEAGVQMGLYTDCTFTEPVYCNSACNVEPITFDSDVLSPGETYYFFIDGCFGSVCSFEINVEGNPIPVDVDIEELCIIDNGNVICEDAEYCLGQVILFTVNEYDAIAEYQWEITTLSGGPYLDNATPITTKGEIDILFGNTGTYSICLDSVSSQCLNFNWNGQVCRTVTINGAFDEVFDTLDICEDALVDFDFSILDEEDPNGDGIFGWNDSDFIFSFGPNVSVTIDADDCSIRQEIFIKEIENPQISISPNSDILCVGDSLEIVLTTNSIIDAISWTINDIPQTEGVGVLFPSVGEYNIFATVSNECGSSSDDTLILVLDTISAPSVICDTSSTGVIILSWSDIDGADGYLLSLNSDSSFVVNDSFYVIENLISGEVVNVEFNVIDSSKCVGPNITFSCMAKIVVGVDQIIENNIQITPNPTSDFISIRGDITAENTFYQIFAIDGELIFSGRLDASKSINVSNLPVGLYILKISENDIGTKVGRFIKND